VSFGDRLRLFRGASERIRFIDLTGIGRIGLSEYLS
jgi:hypothetical protein